MIIARSSLKRPSGTSFKYMKTVINGACPFVVIKVTTWYWIVWTPLVISFFKRSSANALIFSSSNSIPIALNSSLTSLLNFCLLTSTNGAKWDKVILCPPYWELATCAIICVATLQAVEKLFGFSIIVSEITVPFCNISSRFTKSQLCICWEK